MLTLPMHLFNNIFTSQQSHFSPQTIRILISHRIAIMSRGSNSAPNYNELLKKTEHYDKDERYMAISDLCEALKRNQAQSGVSADAAEGASSNKATSSSSYASQIDSQTERRICSAVLSLLDDSSNDVQTVAVKTLSVLLTSVQEEQVVEIADRLCTLVLDQSKSDLRDVYAIGLKTMVEKIPSSMGNIVSHRLISRLIEGIHTNSTTGKSARSPGTTTTSEDKSSEEIVLACLNVLTDLLTRFGSVSNAITQQHEPLLNVTLSQLASPRPVVRKRAGTTIGVLATVISDTLLHRLVERILDQIDQAEGLGKSGKKRARKAHKGGVMASEADLRSADTRSLIRTMCTVSGTVGQRLNQGHIDRSEYSLHLSLSEVVFVWGFQKVPCINLSYSILLTCHVLTSLHSNSFSCPHFPTFL